MAFQAHTLPSGESNDMQSGQCGYVFFYKNQRHEVHANTLWGGKVKAANMIRAKKTSDITIMLAEKNGEPVVHVAVD